MFVDPGAFQNMFMGVGILKVKSLFRKLRKLALRYGGVIVFFDEADSLGSRGQGVGQPGRAGAMTPVAPYDAVPRDGLPVAAHAGVALLGSLAPSVEGRAAAHRTARLRDGRDDGRRRHGHAAGAAHRAVRAQEAARLRQPGRPPHPRHAAEAAAEVPDPGDDGDQPAERAGRGAAAARAASTGSTTSATRPRTAGSAPTRATSTRCGTS
jgi:hypothetical protein